LVFLALEFVNGVLVLCPLKKKKASLLKMIFLVVVLSVEENNFLLINEKIKA
jgi:hypothetical protein